MKPSPATPADYKPTPRTRVKRLHTRGRYDRETVHAYLDAGYLCHVGYVIDGQPFVTPTSYWREGERIYWHGSSASRMLRTVAEEGVRCCVTVSHVDGLVLARSAFHHSINYRAVMAFGAAHKVTDTGEKLAALENFVERLYPGRWKELRPATALELRATTVLWMELQEVSAKTRTGPPVDDDPDYALPIWAGVVPAAMSYGKPQDDPKLTAGIAPPKKLLGEPFTRPRR